MPRGSHKGERRGGRQKGTLNKSTAEVRELIDNVGKKYGGIESVLGKLFELTQGVTVEEVDKKGSPIVYEKPPDSFAAKILLEYRYGKPAQILKFNDDDDIQSVQISIVKAK